jgi:DNA topoisomerase-1
MTLDFLGKDSMRFHQTIDLTPHGRTGALVLDNLKKFCGRKKEEEDVFDQLNPSKLNKELQSIMPGLSAKVFRTYNASITLQKELPRGSAIEYSSVANKRTEYNTANRLVAELCNHQRTVPKSFEASMAKMGDAVALLKRQVRELKAMLADVRKGKEVKLKTPGLEEKEARAQESHLFSRQPGEEAVAKRLNTFKTRLSTKSLALKDKDDNKTVALGTSKINYMDPRITVAWCKAVECPIEKVFPKALCNKFAWAMAVDQEWEF